MWELSTQWETHLCPKLERLLKENINHDKGSFVYFHSKLYLKYLMILEWWLDIVNRACTCRKWDILELPSKQACVLKSIFPIIIL